MRQGWSLVETLIALSLSSFLLLAVSASFLAVQQQQRWQQVILEVEENAQLIRELLQHELRMAGFAAHIPENFPPPALASCTVEKQWLFQFFPVLDSQENNHTSLLNVPLQSSCLNITRVPDSDVLFIRRLEEQATIKETFYADWYWLEAINEEHSRFIYLENWPNDSEIANLWRVQSKLFYVRAYSVKGDNIPSLVMVSANATGFTQQVLVENVVALQLQWQVEKNTGFQLIRKPTAEQLSYVKLVRVHLLLRSKAPLNEAALSQMFYLADKQALVFTDKYFRQSFAFSTLLRNME